MKRLNLQLRGDKILASLMLFFVLAIGFSLPVAAQLDKPEAPVLSLVGEEGDSWRQDLYPDGRIWLPPSVNGDREFLLPVWINNKWQYYPGQTPKFVPFKITSFSFGIMYDSTALRAVGVQKFGPLDEVEGEEPLAKNFHITWYDQKDMSYKEVFYDEPNTQRPPFSERDKGRLIRVIGTTTSDPLATTDKAFKILIYVRFKVVPRYGSGNFSPKPPIYIKNDTIKYNDWNVAKEPPFMKQRAYDADYVTAYPFDASYKFHGLGGVDNLYLNLTENYVPGSVTVQITDQVPQFAFNINRGVGAIEAIKRVNPDMWEIVDPITIDSNSTNPIFGLRIMEILNLVSGTRMMDIEIESDQPWLEFKTGSPGAAAGTEKTPNPIRNQTRKSTPQQRFYIDNGILGDERDPLNEVTTPDKPVKLQVICNPNNLTLDGTSEKAGIYVGYLTFHSHSALINPVRVRVTFIYFRNPVEGGLQGRNYGINLLMRNSRGTVGDSSRLIFGTGYRATDNVDTLFGEFAYNEPWQDNNFSARFFPLDPEIQSVIPYGFGDWAPNDEFTRTTIRQGNLFLIGSRDIRSINDTTASIIYYCRFNAAGAQNYPVTIEWDTLDFPPGSQLFLRDSVNGSHFNVDMRRATPLGGSKFSYVISDPRWKSFIIEYTLPRVIEYVDQYGNPKIKPGWNFLSLPVRPTNYFWKTFYPNAINVPFQFSQNQYQQEEFLRPGIGYFIKYPNEAVDKRFTGTSIHRIQRDQTGFGDVVRLYEGWNTIGTLSVPFNINNLELDRFDNNTIPDVRESLKKGIYGYVTNRGYIEVSILEPGLGYWLYSNKGGYLKMIATAKATAGFNYQKDDVLASSTLITVRDNAQNEGNVYLNNNSNLDMSSFNLPPRPPQELFDIRFANDALISNDNESIISLQGVSYPLSINIDNPNADYTFVDAATGIAFGTIARNVSGNVIVPFSKSNAIKVLKSNDENNFSLSNYPNPVGSFSTVSYSVPENGNVTITLFDTFGNEIATLLNDFRKAGNYNDVQIDALNIAAGTYFCKMVIGGQSVVSTVSVIK